MSSNVLRFTTAGNVDDGKSTLIGRLLVETQGAFLDQIEGAKRENERRGGKGIDFSLLTDGLKAEREQGITIDVAYRYFATPKRKFIIADAPGHEQYTRNLVTSASNSDLAVILIDARNGIMTQSRRHTFIAHLLGIRHFIVAVNKMDLVISAANATRRSSATSWTSLTSWVARKSIASRYRRSKAITSPNRASGCPGIPDPRCWNFSNPFKSTTPHTNCRSALPCNSSAARRLPRSFPISADTWDELASGSVKVGDRIVVLPSGGRSTVTSIVTRDGNAGRSIRPAIRHADAGRRSRYLSRRHAFCAGRPSTCCAHGL